jgi:hypothetical protein
MVEIIGDVGLTGIVLIDIGIGVIFAILTFSLIASALQEAIAGVLNFRGEHLRRGILRLMREKQLGDKLLTHPLIEGLKGPKNMVQKIAQVLFMWGDTARDKDRMPSSIPKDAFARALVETLVERRNELMATIDDATTRAQRAADLVGLEIDGLALDNRLKGRLKAVVTKLDFDKIESHAEAMIDGALDEAGARIQQIEENLEIMVEQVEAELANWFDSAMDRVTGWYVRRAKTMLFVIGALAASAMNFDIIGYGIQLARDDAMRSAVVERAQAAVATGQVGEFRIDGPKIETLAATAEGQESPTEEQKAAQQTMTLFDLNGNGKLDPNEIDAADKMLTSAWDVVRDSALDAAVTVRSELGGTGALGASFLDAEPIIQLRMVLSWILIGLGCTLGGQFWFDLLKTFLKVRAGASGLNSDIEKVTRQIGDLRERIAPNNHSSG